MFTRAHVCAKTRNPAHNISVILTCPARCLHTGEAPVHVCYPERVLGSGNSPPVALVVPALLVNYNFAHGCFSSCTHCPILRLGKPRMVMSDWLTVSQFTGQKETMASGRSRHPCSAGGQASRGKAGSS